MFSGKRPLDALRSIMNSLNLISFGSKILCNQLAQFDVVVYY